MGEASLPWKGPKCTSSTSTCNHTDWEGYEEKKHDTTRISTLPSRCNNDNHLEEPGSAVARNMLGAGGPVAGMSRIRDRITEQGA